jgi:hypothetical protein
LGKTAIGEVGGKKRVGGWWQFIVLFFVVEKKIASGTPANNHD